MNLGKEKDNKPFAEVKKYVGCAECTVVGFNLTRQEIISKCGYDPGSEPDYNRKGKGGERGLMLVAYVKEKTTGSVHKVPFFMEERVDTSQKGNKRYVNSKCQNSYVLTEWFTKSDHREAYVGEAEYLNFVRNWLYNRFDWFNVGPDTGNYPLDDTKLLFTGNVKGLNDLTSKYSNETVGVQLGIREADNGYSYQDVFNRAFVPGYAVKKYMEGLPTGTTDAERKLLTGAVRDFLRVVEGDYGYKNFVGNTYTFREYDPKTNVVAGNNSAVLNKDELSF